MKPCVRGDRLIWRGHKQAVNSRDIRRFYRQTVGPVNPGDHIHHICGNPWCIEPTHLEALTFAEHIIAHRYRGMLSGGFDETAFALG